MRRSDAYLKTQQLADALGLGVSTVKRWVDSGQIKATRTLGKHRLIALEEAIRFARSHHLPTSALQGLAHRGSGAAVEVDDRARDLLTTALTEGRGQEARRLIASAHGTLGSGWALADELIAPVMERIGHGWSVGTVDIFQEHQASQIVATALNELIARAGRGGDEPKPVAIGATPEGDLYTIGGLLGELTLREIGYDVRNLGANLPLRSLARAVDSTRPRLVYLTVTHLVDPIGFVRDAQDFCRSAFGDGASVILGGRALRAEIRLRIEGATFGDRIEDLAVIGRRLLPTPNGNLTKPVEAGAMDRPAPDATNN